MERPVGIWETHEHEITQPNRERRVEQNLSGRGESREEARDKDRVWRRAERLEVHTV